MGKGEFDSRIDGYVRKFGGASRFVQKIIDSLDCPFAIVNTDSLEIEITNVKGFSSGMKCRDLFRCFGDNCDGEECPIEKVVESGRAIVVNNNGSGGLLEIHIHPISDSMGKVVSVIVYGFDVAQSQALVESEEKFHSLFEGSVDAIFIADCKTQRFIDCNQKALDLTKFSKEEILKKKVSDLHPVHVQEESREKFKRQVRGEDFIVETELLTKDNKIIPVSINARIIKIGNVEVMQGIFRDISERKKVEGDLRESEERFRSLFERQLSAYALHKIITDKDGKPIDYEYLEINSMFEEFLNLKREDVIGKRVTEVIPGIEKESVDWIGKFGEVALTGKSFKIEEFSKQLGRWYSISAYSPEKGYFVAVFDDITERKEIENRLREKEEMHVKEVEERFYNILQNSQDLVYRYNFRTDGFDYVSESVFTILGYSLGEFMKMNRDDYSKLVHPDDVAVFGYTGESSELESVSDIEYRFKKKNGDYIWLKVKRVFFRDKDGNLIYSIEDVKDISAEKSVLEERAKLEERIAHMRSKASQTKERSSLTDREKLVLWGFCRYPLLNDEELASKLDLKRSTLTAIKNRLKGKGWFGLSYIPNFCKLDCQFFSIFDMNFKSGKAKGADFIKNVPNVVLDNFQDNKFLGVFVSDKYVDFKRFLEELAGIDMLKYDFNEDSFFYDLDSVKWYGVSGLINSLFNLNRKEKPVVYKFENGGAELNVNEKRVLHAIVKDPEMSSAEIAKKIWTSKPTVIKVKKKLLERGYVYPCVVPDFRKIGFPYIARLSFSFDSDLSVVNGKGSKDARVVLQVSGKNKVMKIMLFGSEEEYEDEVDMIKEFYRKEGVDFKLNSEIFLMQKRRSGNSKMESFVNDKLFGDEI